MESDSYFVVRKDLNLLLDDRNGLWSDGKMQLDVKRA